MGMESKFHSKLILGLLTILPLLASISIVNNFGEAFAKSELDFNQCIGFLSVDEVKTSVGYSGELNVTNHDFTQKALEANPNLQTQCSITFKSTSFESAVSLMVAEFNSTEAADEKYTKSLHDFERGDFSVIRGEFDDWKIFEATSGKTLVKNLLAAQYQTYLISLNTSLSDEDLAVIDDLKNLSTIVLEKLGMDTFTITKDREELKTQSPSDQISEGNPLTESSILEEKTMSPYYQLKIGTAAKDINCNEGLELILNPLNGNPNCVKPNTASVLIKRGWTTT